jgi:hypothetical protein
VTGPTFHPVDVAHAALMEAGRPDLAAAITWFEGPGQDFDGGYLEANDDIYEDADWALIDKAETIARRSVGLPPINRDDIR